MSLRILSKKDEDYWSNKPNKLTCNKRTDCHVGGPTKALFTFYFYESLEKKNSFCSRIIRIFFTKKEILSKTTDKMVISRSHDREF